MAKNFTVTVTDDATGAVLMQATVDVSLSAGTNADRADLNDIEKALYVVGPELCPYDCSSCG